MLDYIQIIFICGGNASLLWQNEISGRMKMPLPFFNADCSEFLLAFTMKIQ